MLVDGLDTFRRSWAGTPMGHFGADGWVEAVEAPSEVGPVYAMFCKLTALGLAEAELSSVAYKRG